MLLPVESQYADIEEFISLSYSNTSLLNFISNDMPLFRCPDPPQSF